MFDESVKKANAAMTRFGGNEMAEVIQQAGLANHPVMLKMFARVQRALGEDNLTEGKPVAEGSGLPPEAILYPDLYKQQQGV